MRSINRSVKYGVISKTGLIKTINQDRVLIKIGEKGSIEFGMFVIADGMGGHAYGEVASTIAINTLTHWWDNELKDIILEAENIWIVVKKRLIACFQTINEIIHTSTAAEEKMGTTLTVLFLYGDKYVITHIGDSRVYINNGEELEQLTKDHSLIGTVIRQNDVSYNKVSQIINKNILTQCIGIKEMIYPYSKIGYVGRDNLFLLCSDGLYNFIAKEQLNSIITKNIKQKTTIQCIVDKIYNIIMKNGAGDNVSIILIHYSKNTWF